MKKSKVITASLIVAMLFSLNTISVFAAQPNSSNPEPVCAVPVSESKSTNPEPVCVVPVSEPTPPSICVCPPLQKAKKNPIITASNKTVKKGSNFGYTEAIAGVKAVDDKGKGMDITCYVIVNGLDKVKTNVPGTYKITYSVDGYTGKTVTKSVNVKVVK